ncbi:uncharacterized protein ColSpa_00094 [Colletotrichum spaethianum]|uniref:HAUS augmin-like complex subunit 1 n=1 Tax=Colletotrichum spaethianum TaxID=700344 RepID=A0AA37L0V5_9PEZI|nr:uncharacterized protein ColSpa_00094 [Colletotrichum spaethianum]GKT39913.1 hypothetical protein ColSpa_00094 [Colletotrichum spaethianum]
MAHLPPSTAIFSPSIARIAASTAKDWSYVDNWLSSKYQGRSVPAFERNPETLKALLVLANSNETADDERELVARAELGAIQESAAARDQSELNSDLSTSATARERMLGAVQDHLTREGRTALNSMATLSCELSVAYPDAETLGRSMIGLHAEASELEQMRVRVQILQKYIEQESAAVDELLRTLRSDDYKPANELARQNLEMQRRVKAMAARIPELRDRKSNLNQHPVASHPTIEQIAQEEADYLGLLAQKKGLDEEVDQFSGLPDDVKSARAELEHLRAEVHTITHHRDAIFEGLVERESPHKGR